MAGKVVGSMFEEGYLIRDLRSVAQIPDVAISELVANAWDASATRVDIRIPENVGEIISVTDSGKGMTPEQFRERWMTHGYNRLSHQGEFAEPLDSSPAKRRAYGRNGIGRHGMFCFADKYSVDTRREGSEEAWRFTVEPSSGKDAFILVGEEKIKRPSHGTTVWTHVIRSLPLPKSIYESLAFKFLHEPNFTIAVNDQTINIEDQKIVANEKITLENGTVLELLCVEVPTSRHRMVSHGVAFWVGGRLVGDPIYNLFGIQLLDGRTTVANRHMFVVKTDDLFADIESDWTGFRKTNKVELAADAVRQHIDVLVSSLMSGKIEENKSHAIRENREEIRKLRPLSRIEVSEFVDDLVSSNPTLNADILSAAVKAAVNLEKSRSGRALLEKLALLSMDDVERINTLLDTWTLRDALAVLEELDRRISVIEAIEKLMDDPAADELHSIHPLVSHARWLFGPEYDSPMYASNVTIQKSAEHVFKRKIDPTGIMNPRQRPDLIFLKSSTISLTGTQQYDESGTLLQMNHLLVIELKRGNFTITSKEVQQAETYVLDLLNCKLLDGSPFVHAFVVGHKVDKRARSMQVGSPPKVEGTIQAVSFGQLIRTADHRLMNLRETIAERYKNVPGLDLVNKVIGEGEQQELFPTKKIKKTRARKKNTKKKPAKKR